MNSNEKNELINRLVNKLIYHTTMNDIKWDMYKTDNKDFFRVDYSINFRGLYITLQNEQPKLSKVVCGSVLTIDDGVSKFATYSNICPRVKELVDCLNKKLFNEDKLFECIEKIVDQD